MALVPISPRNKYRTGRHGFYCICHNPCPCHFCFYYRAGLLRARQSDGFIEKKQEASVNIPPGIPIESVFVKPGQMVEKNTPLFQIDMDGLQEMIIEDSNEIEKLTLQINDIAANQQFEARRQPRTRSPEVRSCQRGGTTERRIKYAK